MHSKKLTNKKQKFSPKIKKGFRDGLSYSTPQKAKKQGEMTLPSLGPNPSLNSTFFIKELHDSCF